MLRKTIILLTILTTFICATEKSTNSFGKEKKEPIDSLYARDIREVKSSYPEIKVIECEQVGAKKTEQDDYSPNAVKIKYPMAAKDNGIQGTVYGRYIVDTMGVGKDFKILRGIGGGCDQEILRAMKEMATFPIKVPKNESGKKIELYLKVIEKFTLR